MVDLGSCGPAWIYHSWFSSSLWGNNLPEAWWKPLNLGHRVLTLLLRGSPQCHQLTQSLHAEDHVRMHFVNGLLFDRLCSQWQMEANKRRVALPYEKHPIRDLCLKDDSSLASRAQTAIRGYFSISVSTVGSNMSS